MRIMTNYLRGAVSLLVCLLSFAGIAAASPPISKIPTGPKDVNGNWATPDYYTTANWANSPPMAKFVDKLPGLGSAKSNGLGQYLPIAKPDVTTYPGSDYYEIDLIEYRQRMHSDLPETTGSTTGSMKGTLLRGYVQVNKGTDLTPGSLPSQGLCGPVPGHACTMDHTTFGLLPDAVHYLGPVIVSERDRPVRIKFRNRLPAGSDGNLFIPVDQTVMGAGSGPGKGTGTRGAGNACSNDITPTVTIVGGQPILNINPGGCDYYPQNRADIHLHGGRTPWISDGTPHQWITPVEEITPFTKGSSFYNVPDMPDPGDGAMTYYFTNQQSARLMFYHDHAFGITRLNVYAGEAAGYLITDKFEQDLITRGIIPSDQIPLIIQDKTFVDATPVMHPATGEPTTRIRVTDPLWNWGSGTPDVNGIRPPVTGDLWMPHVYMPAQTSTAGVGGVNAFGRWMYGPWFYPATVVDIGPQPNPYYDPHCSSANPLELAECQTPGQPEKIPGTPYTSMGMEAFQDSIVVNGTAFPSLTVDPRAYRFRILNAASDRFQNLSFYLADSTPDNISPDSRLLASGKSNRTEVKIAPASPALAAANNWPADWPVDGRDSGVPDPGLCQPGGVNCPNFGPNFLQIASEGGFLPKPVVIAPQPITWITDPTAFWVGNVDKMGLALGPAERADVIVDFSNYAGKTLILYNDAPAAWPARVVGYDYFTGAPDGRDAGGYGAGGVLDPATGTYVADPNDPANVPHGILPGYAPNTRTVMQVIVTNAVGTADPVPAIAYNQANLEKEFTVNAPATAVNPAPVKTLFERAQEPIVVGQAAYSDAYPNSYFPFNFPWEGISQINDHYFQFVTVAGEQVKTAQEYKGIHDEMGASFDPVYGRMSGNLAMQLPLPKTNNANLILYGFSDLPTETIKNSTTVNVQVLPNADPLLPGSLADGTQIWKISHNGVDTHPIHFHIFDVQLLNRVGWDGQMLMPEPNELGWKDTVKISPLEDTIVAVRPRAPALPFGIPESTRPLNPALPLGTNMGLSQLDPVTGQAYMAPSPYAGGVTNMMYNFGWEYVWHCHILSHEEMDMMRPIVLQYDATLPSPVTVTKTITGNDVNLSWNDPTPANYTAVSPDYGVAAAGSYFGDTSNEVGFNVYRTTAGGTTIPVGADGHALPLNSTPLLANKELTYTDLNAPVGEKYIVEIFNAKGSSLTYVDAAFNPTVTATATGPFVSPATVTLNAVVADLPTGATVTKVEFYDGTTLLNTNSALSFSYVWTGGYTGAHSITAKAYISSFANNLILTSPAVAVTITGNLSASFTPLTGAYSLCSLALFDSTASTVGVNPVTYSWSINGATYTGATVTMKNSDVNSPNPLLIAGNYPVTLTITDTGTGEISQVTNTITINGNNAPVVANLPLSFNITNRGIIPADYGTFTATDTDACDSLKYGWNFSGKNGYTYYATPTPTFSFTALKSVLGLAVNHEIKFIVTDASGASATATSSITINEIPAVVALTAPTTASKIISGEPVTLSATASIPANNAGITLAAVNFYDGITLLGPGVLNGQNYEFIWTPAVVGTHAIKAIAVDNVAYETTTAVTSLKVVAKPDGVISPDNLTGTPTLADALLLYQYLNGVATLSVSQLANADVAPADPVNFKAFGDNVVDFGDLLMILRKVVGLAVW